MGFREICCAAVPYCALCEIGQRFISATKKRHPSADFSVRADARVICEDPPVADTCRRIDSPKPHGQRENRRDVVLDHPEDYRRAAAGRSANRRPAAARGRSRHGAWTSPGLPTTGSSLCSQFHAASSRNYSTFGRGLEVRDFSRESIIRTCAITRAACASLINVLLSGRKARRSMRALRSTGGSTCLSAADACETQVSDSAC